MSMITELIERLRESADDTELDMECSRACDGECNKLLKEAADVIEELSTKLRAANMERSSQYYNGGWIPVSERLPEKYTYTLWCSLGGCVQSDYFNGEFWEDAEKYGYEVIAWKPLPKPYVGSENKE